MNEAEPTLNYLKTVARLRASMSSIPGSDYFGAEDLVADRGTAWSQEGSCPLTAEESRVLFRVVDSVGQRFRIKQCFFNSQVLSAYDDTGQLKYWEGWAQGNAVIPLHHSWITINEKVIDLTWRLEKPRTQGRLRNRVQGKVPEDWAYLGVHIPKKTIIEELCRSGIARGLLFSSKLDLYQLPRIGSPPEPYPSPKPWEAAEMG